MARIFSDHLFGAKKSLNVEYVVYPIRQMVGEALVHGASLQIAVNRITWFCLIVRVFEDNGRTESA